MSDIPILTLNTEKTQINLLEKIGDSIDIIKKSSLNFFEEKDDQIGLLEAFGKKIGKKEETKKEDPIGLLDAFGKQIIKKEENRNKKEEKDRKEEKEETKKRNMFLETVVGKLKTVGDESVNVLNTTKDNIIQGLAGPFRLLLDPLKEFTGFDILGKISEVSKIKIKAKTSPTKKDLSETADGQAELYRENQAKKGKEKKGKDSKILGFFPASFGKIGKILLKALPIAALAGGIIWGVFDGIQGALKAGKFGGTKISGFIAGFLAGTGSGWKNAFKSAGKLALVGAGAGFLAAGPVGALVGGLIGAAVGGILGYFGHEKVTKGLDKVGATLKEHIFDGLSTFFVGIKDSVVKPFKEKSDKNIAFKVGAALGGLVKFLGKTVVNIFKSKGKFGAKGAAIGFAIGSIPGAILGGVIGLAVDGIVGLFKITKAKFFPDMNIGDIVKEKIGKVFSFLGNIVTEFLDGLTGGKFSEAKEAIKEINPFGQIKEFIIDMKNNVVSFFTFIGDFFGFLKEGFKAKNILSFIGTIAKGEFGEEFGAFREKREEERGVVDDSFATMNDEMKKKKKKKVEIDQKILDELIKSNKKQPVQPNVIQNNVSDNTFNPNAIRTNLQYLNKGTL